MTVDLVRRLRNAQVSKYRAGPFSVSLKISRKTFERTMKNLVGKTPQAWLSEQRLVVAAEMLAEHRRPKFVAHTVGFKQLSHFSREFKLHFGVGPRAFIRLRSSTQRNAALTKKHALNLSAGSQPRTRSVSKALVARR